MRRRLLRLSALAVIGLSLVLAGAAMGSDCDGHTCDADTGGCDLLAYTVQDLCCRDSDEDEVYHCITCYRHRFICWNGGNPYAVTGPPYSCFNPGAECQP